ncbi:MAG: hypothetical protein NHB32_06700 [Fischerella sp. CENA71]|nr:hypothetical protein [Fischerella sp. CENA71]
MVISTKAEVYGIPFAFIPCAGSNKAPKPAALPEEKHILNLPISWVLLQMVDHKLLLGAIAPNPPTPHPL